MRLTFPYALREYLAPPACKGSPKKWCEISNAYSWSFNCLITLFCNLLNKDRSKESKPLLYPTDAQCVMVGVVETQQCVCLLPDIMVEELLLLGPWSTSHGNFTEWKSTTSNLLFPGSLSARRQLCLQIHQKAVLPLQAAVHAVIQAGIALTG